jgi:hypothetical protein
MTPLCGSYLVEVGKRNQVFGKNLVSLFYNGGSFSIPRS